jgi:hypothetical protein
MYEQKLAAQGGVCAICKRKPGKKPLAVDHDHGCRAGNGKTCGKCVRGLLCEDCNLSLGKMNDDPVRLIAAVDYLTQWDSVLFAA